MTDVLGWRRKFGVIGPSTNTMVQPDFDGMRPPGVTSTTASKATQWRPGQSGNPNGRPVGARQTFSAGFHRDLAEVWQAHGRNSMLHTAKTQPATFFSLRFALG